MFNHVNFHNLIWPHSALFIRPHCSTEYIEAAYCYQPSSVVCRSVCHTSEPCKNGCTDRDAVWVEDSGRPKEPCIRWGPDPPWEGAVWGRKGCPIAKYRDMVRFRVKTAEPIAMLFGLCAWMGRRNRVRWGSSGAEWCCHGNQFLGCSLL